MKDCCPLCSSDNIVPNLFVKNNVSSCVGKLDSNLLSQNEVSSINLCQCYECGFVYNAAFDADKINKGYQSPDYVLRKSISPSISSKINLICDYVATQGIDETSTSSKIGLEVGCGNGDMSYALSSKIKRLYTVDPSEESNIVKTLPNIIHINDFFCKEIAQKHLRTNVDIVILRHILEHISSPAEFIETLAAIANVDCILYIELPNMNEIIQSGRFFDIFHDHFGYFQHNTVVNLLAKHGFTWLNTESFHNNQHQGLFFKKSLHTTSECDSVIMRYTTSNFDLFQQHINKLNELISQYNNVCIYGAGAHANSILNYITDSNKTNLCLCLDKDKSKQGKYLQSSNIQIVAPCLDNLHQIDAILVASALYEDEIINDIRKYFHGDIITTSTRINLIP